MAGAFRGVLLLMAGAGMAACSDDATRLVVDVRSDLTPGLDFVEVRIDLVEARTDAGAARITSSLRPASMGEDWSTGLRVGDFDLDGAGEFDVRGVLLDTAESVVLAAATRVQAEAGRTTTVTLLLTRGACEGQIVPTPTTVECARSTLTCIDACATSQCQVDCLDSDPRAAECRRCVGDAPIACTNALGCQARWDALVCCFADDCAELTSDQCYEGPCAAALRAQYDCAAPFYAGECLGAHLVCFP